MARLTALYTTQIGTSALGIDLPSVQTDIMVPSVRQPKSSGTFRTARQKVYGLGYNLLVFIYEKQDDQLNRTATLRFVDCAFINQERTADYQTTRGISEVLGRDGNRDDILAFLEDRNLPCDEIMLNALADEIIQSPPIVGYLTISNALHWRCNICPLLTLYQRPPPLPNPPFLPPPPHLT